MSFFPKITYNAVLITFYVKITLVKDAIFYNSLLFLNSISHLNSFIIQFFLFFFNKTLYSLFVIFT